MMRDKAFKNRNAKPDMQYLEMARPSSGTSAEGERRGSEGGDEATRGEEDVRRGRQAPTVEASLVKLLQRSQVRDMRAAGGGTLLSSSPLTRGARVKDGGVAGGQGGLPPRIGVLQTAATPMLQGVRGGLPPRIGAGGRGSAGGGVPVFSDLSSGRRRMGVGMGGREEEEEEEGEGEKGRSAVTRPGVTRKEDGQGGEHSLLGGAEAWAHKAAEESKEVADNVNFLGGGQGRNTTLGEGESSEPASCGDSEAGLYEGCGAACAEDTFELLSVKDMRRGDMCRHLGGHFAAAGEAHNVQQHPIYDLAASRERPIHNLQCRLIHSVQPGPPDRARVRPLQRVHRRPSPTCDGIVAPRGARRAVDRGERLPKGRRFRAPARPPRDGYPP